MTAIDEIAFSLGIRDEVPNQILARKLVSTSDITGIREIAEHLWDRNTNIQNDCIKVIYEVGEIQPDLIEGYVENFVKLLKAKNNRMVWGAMTALAAVSVRDPMRLSPFIDDIMKATRDGSVITIDNGIKALARIASASEDNQRAVFPFLLEHLKKCRPKEVPQHAESTLPAVNTGNKMDFIQVLHERIEDLSPAGLARVRKVIKQAERL